MSKKKEIWKVEFIVPISIIEFPSLTKNLKLIVHLTEYVIGYDMIM